MARPTNRRTVLMAAGVVAVAATAGPVAARSDDIRGEVTFEGGAVIPKGQIEIYLEDPAIQDKARRRDAEARIDSDGAATRIAFSLPAPASPAASPALQVVARLERADGWLLARGSAPFEADAPVNVTLSTVMY